MGSTCSYWIDPDRLFDCAIALTDDVIYVANPPSGRAMEIRSALERGEAASAAMKDEATEIPISSIRKVSYNRHDDDVDIAYMAGKENETKNISFDSHAERDEFAEQLDDLLHGFEAKVVEYGPVRAALGPLCFGAVAGGFTWLFHAAALQIVAGAETEFSGRRSGLKRMVYWAVDLVGPIGVLVIGGLALALTGWLLVRRVKTPPIMHILKPGRE